MIGYYIYYRQEGNRILVKKEKENNVKSHIEKFHFIQKSHWFLNSTHGRDQIKR